MANSSPPAAQPQQIADNEWSIELLRGLAALMVVYAHYRVFGGAPPSVLDFAFSGVDLFFVISGFVFAPYFYGKKLDITPFFVRRLLRIYPLYVVALGVYAALRHLNGQGSEHLLEHLFFLHTLESKEIAFYYNPAFWSLPPEVEFYLALPVLCVLFRGERRVGVLLVLAGLSHLGLVAMLGSGNGAARAAEISLFHLPGVLAEFLLGTLAWKVASLQPRPAIRGVLLLAGGALWTMLALIFMHGGDAAIEASWWLRGNVGILSAAAYALAVAAIVGWVKAAPPALRTASLWMGNLSFGIYLFHNAIPTTLGPFVAAPSGALFAVACTIGTLTLSYVAHRFYEEPLRQWGRKQAKRMQARPPVGEVR